MIRRAFVAVAVVGLVTFLVWVPSLGNGFVWDDEANVVGNDGFKGFSSANVRWMLTAFHMGHYHPLTWASLAIDHAIWGMNPAGYHLTNAILHALSAAVLAWMASMLFREASEDAACRGPQWRSSVPPHVEPAKAGGPGADPFDAGSNTRAGGPKAIWFGAAIALAWSIHPLRVEAVTWVTQRREVLCGLLSLLAIASRLRGRPWWISALLAIAAMLAKVTAVTLPFLFVLIDVWKSGGFEPGWPGRASRAAIRQAPLFVAAGVLVVVSFLAQREANAIVSTEFLSATGRVGLYFFGLAFCVSKTLVPLGLAPLHQGQVGCTWTFQPFVWWWAAAGAVIAAAALVVAWRARRSSPAALLFVLAFLGLLVPAGGLGQSGPQIAAERYTYQPAWILTAGCVLLLARTGWLDRAPARAVAIVILAALGVATVLQQRHWRDAESLWLRELDVHPDNAFSSFVLGYHYLSRQPPALDLAEPRLRNAVANLSDYVDARKALAGVLRETGRAPEAIEVLDDFVRRHPGNSEAYRLLAKAHAADGRGREAATVFERGVAAAPSPGLFADYAWMLATDPDAAVRNGSRARELALPALKSAPSDPRMLVMTAAALAESGAFEEARDLIAGAIARGAGSQEAALRHLQEDLANRRPVRAPARFP